MSSRIEGPPSESDSTPEPDIDIVHRRTMKRITALFASGVTIVTTRRNGGLHGLTVSAYMTVSWEPPLIAVSVESLSQSSNFIKDSGVFAVNFLSEMQEFLAERFAGRAPLVNTRFDGVPHRAEATGAPILDGSIGWLDCRVEQVIDAGDHVLFVGRVVRLGESAKDKALVYFNRRYRAIEP
jgi:flavin reductase (DIM6/NTAB) family NADH-FMN oxidoreductase RutF